MPYMVVEQFKRGAGPVYERLGDGRQLPSGVSYLGSWVVDEPEISRCFQLMDAESPQSLQQWLDRWSDLVEFEVFPVISSDEAAQRVTRT